MLEQYSLAIGCLCVIFFLVDSALSILTKGSSIRQSHYLGLMQDPFNLIVNFRRAYSLTNLQLIKLIKLLKYDMQ